MIWGTRFVFSYDWCTILLSILISVDYGLFVVFIVFPSFHNYKSQLKMMELYTNNPGPLDDSVLYDQEKHVSAAVWEGQVQFFCILNC